MIAIIILGIIFGLGSNYFFSLWREHHISVQSDYLHREAIYAMDFIINGRMEGVQGKFSRKNGIIGSYGVKIIGQGTEGSEIWFIDANENMYGRIYPNPSVNPTSLLFDDDMNKNNGYFQIIPRLSETGIQNPYKIEISFSETSDRKLINIGLKLKQNAYGRGFEVKMHSKVRLRNYFKK